MKRRGLIALVAALGLARDGWGAGADPDIQAHFECLWWTEAEMEGINPNRPPPKTTRVRIAKWEYSDPIGVPNPDEVILVLSLRAVRARRLALAVQTSWRVRSWRAPETLARRVVELADGETRREEFVIPVRTMILDREARGLRVSVQADGRAVLRIALPIQGGD